MVADSDGMESDGGGVGDEGGDEGGGGGERKEEGGRKEGVWVCGRGMLSQRGVDLLQMQLFSTCGNHSPGPLVQSSFVLSFACYVLYVPQRRGSQHETLPMHGHVSAEAAQP